MSSINHAYQTAFNMNRKPENVLLAPFVITDLEEKRRITTMAVGTNDEYMCVIEHPSTVFSPKLNEMKDDARWHCDCSDFRFTFYPHIDNQGEALASFPEYIPNGRGVPRAISDYGMCKHLMKLVDTLRATNLSIKR